MAGRNHTYRHANTCETTGKRSYLDRKTARKNRRATIQRTGEQVSEINVYQCRHCQLWHIGHAPYTAAEDGEWLYGPRAVEAERPTPGPYLKGDQTTDTAAALDRAHNEGDRSR